MFTKDQIKEMRLKLIEASNLLSEVAHILLNIEEPKCPLCNSFTCKHDARVQLILSTNTIINGTAPVPQVVFTPATKNTGDPLQELQRNIQNLTGPQMMNVIAKLQEKK